MNTLKIKWGHVPLLLQPTSFLGKKNQRKPLTILKLKNGQPIAGQDITYYEILGGLKFKKAERQIKNLKNL